MTFGLPGRTPGARARVAQSDLTAALNGRIRATTPAGPVPIATASTAHPARPGRRSRRHTLRSLEPVAAEPDRPGARPGGGRQPVRHDSVVPGYPPEPPASYAPPSPATFAAASPPSSYSPPASYAAPAYPPSDARSGTAERRPSIAPPVSGLGPRAGHVDPSRAGPVRRPTSSRPSSSRGRSAGRRAAGRPRTRPMAGPQRRPGGRPALAPVVGRERETHDAEHRRLAAPAAAWCGRLRAGERDRVEPAGRGRRRTTPTRSCPRCCWPGSSCRCRPGRRAHPPARPRLPVAASRRSTGNVTSPSSPRRSGSPSTPDSRSRRSTLDQPGFVQLIGAWPDDDVAFAVNPGTPVGATLPGAQIVALASWAAEVGLRDEPTADVVVAAEADEADAGVGVAGAPTAGAERATVMQKHRPAGPGAVLPRARLRPGVRLRPPGERGRPPDHAGPSSTARWASATRARRSPRTPTRCTCCAGSAHRPTSTASRTAGRTRRPCGPWQGWVIERPPFRGNGFAPGRQRDVVAEFKVDSARLPHGAQLWRLERDGTETLVAMLRRRRVRCGAGSVSADA